MDNLSDITVNSRTNAHPDDNNLLLHGAEGTKTFKQSILRGGNRYASDVAAAD